jgi:hypothetical protein
MPSEEDLKRAQEWLDELRGDSELFEPSIEALAEEFAAVRREEAQRQAKYRGKPHYGWLNDVDFETQLFNIITRFYGEDLIYKNRCAVALEMIKTMRKKVEELQREKLDGK